MNNIYRFLAFKIPIAVLLILTSCSIGHRYKMVNEHKFVSGSKRRIELNNLWMSLSLSQFQNNSTSMYVALIFDDVSIGKHIKLSNLKMKLVDIKTGDTAVISKPIAFNGTAYNEIRGSNEYINDVDLRSKVFDLKDRKQYYFGYSFTYANLSLFRSTIQINIEADLYDEGKTETIKKSYIFKRKMYLYTDIIGGI